MYSAVDVYFKMITAILHDANLLLHSVLLTILNFNTFILNYVFCVYTRNGLCL